MNNRLFYALSALNWKSIGWWFCGFILVFQLLYFVLPLSLLASENLRVIQTFDTDEYDFIHLLKKEFDNGTFDINRYVYGHLYYNVGLVVLQFINLFIEVDIQVITVTFRLLSFAFFAGTVLLMYHFALKYFGLLSAWISTLLLVFASNVIHHNMYNVHPDTAQLFFIALSIYFLTNGWSEKSFKNICFSAIAAGCAFSSKYAGILLLPLIVVVVNTINFDDIRSRNFTVKTLLTSIILSTIIVYSDGDFIGKYIKMDVPLKQELIVYFKIIRWASMVTLITMLLCKMSNTLRFIPEICQKTMNAIWKTTLVGSLFIVAFMATSPFGNYWEKYLNGFVFVSHTSTTGHWFSYSTGVIGWLEILTQNKILGMGILVFAFIGIASLITRKPQPRLLVAIWTFLFFSTVAFRVNAKFLHYLLPVFPFIIIMSAFGFEILKNRFKHSKVLILSLTLLLGAQATYSVLNFVNYKHERTVKIVDSSAIKAGNWLANQLKLDDITLSDKYCYLPPNYPLKSYWRWNEQIALDENAEYLIINEKIYSAYLDKKMATTYVMGEETFIPIHNFYTSLLNNSNEYYEPLQDFGPVKIFHKKK